MFDIFGNIKSLLKIQTVSIDNNIFRLHYQVTLSLLVLFSILVGSRQYFGDPIDCTSEHDKITRVIDNYCWMHIYRPKGPFEEQKAHGTSVSKQSGQRPLVYYQWVGFVLFFQAVLFFIPRYLWKHCWEEGKIKGLASGMTGPSTDREKETLRKKQILDYLQRNIGNHNLYFFRYVFCEVLNFVNVITQMIMMDAFFDYVFSTNGWDILTFVNLEPEKRHDPLYETFPKVAECVFNAFGINAEKQNFPSLCVLPVNIFNEKIYVFLWFWFIILTALTCAGLLYRVVSFIPMARAYILHRKTKSVDIRITKDVTSHITVGDWFLLYQIGKNVDSLVFGELLREFGERVVDLRYHELDEIKSETTTPTNTFSYMKENQF